MILIFNWDGSFSQIHNRMLCRKSLGAFISAWLLVTIKCDWINYDKKKQKQNKFSLSLNKTKRKPNKNEMRKDDMKLN